MSDKSKRAIPVKPMTDEDRAKFDALPNTRKSEGPRTFEYTVVRVEDTRQRTFTITYPEGEDDAESSSTQNTKSEE